MTRASNWLAWSAALVFLTSLPGYAQTTWYVDASGTAPGSGTQADPYTSIQFAISQASTADGDTLVVLPGVYLENVGLQGKDLTLVGQDGPDVTSIDGGSSGSVVTLVSGETATLEGFTITQGTGTPVGSNPRGGGIFCQGVSLTIQDCRIVANGTLLPNQGGGLLGGGVYADGGSSLTMVDCEISTNEAHFGAGVYLDASDASAQGCDISFNFAGESTIVIHGGGGILARAGSNLDLDGCTVSGNVVITGDGGGLLIESSSATISDCDIVFNDGGGATVGVTIGEGGGVYATADSVVQITDSNLSDNWGDEGGGGIYGSATLTGCTISRNHGQFGGGAYAVDMTLTDCTIADNRGSSSGSFDFGGGIYVDGTALCVDTTIQGNLINGLGGGGHGGVYLRCVISGNQAGPGSGPDHDGGGGVYLGTLEDCVIFENRVRGLPSASLHSKGGGVDRCYLERCILYGNEAEGLGAAASNSTLIHCTVFGNTAGTSGGALYNDEASMAVLNSIVRRNEPNGIAVEGGSLDVTYSNVEGGWPGTGNINANPLFWNTAAKDFELLPGSPCIDAGDPLSPRDPDGSVADMGALPFDPNHCSAAVTYCTAGVSASGCQAAIGRTRHAQRLGAERFPVDRHRGRGRQGRLVLLRSEWPPGDPLGQRHELPVRRPAREAQRRARARGDQRRLRRRVQLRPERPLDRQARPQPRPRGARPEPALVPRPVQHEQHADEPLGRARSRRVSLMYA